MMSRTRGQVWFASAGVIPVGLFALFFPACGGGGGKTLDGSCAAGALGCRCYGNATCDPGLVCGPAGTCQGAPPPLDAGDASVPDGQNDDTAIPRDAEKAETAILPDGGQGDVTILPDGGQGDVARLLDSPSEDVAISPEAGQADGAIGLDGGPGEVARALDGGANVDAEPTKPPFKLWIGDPFAVALPKVDLCLSVTSGTAGDLVLAQPCAPSTRDRRLGEIWREQPTSGSYFRLVNELGGLCLGGQGADVRTPGAATDVSSCEPTSLDAKQDQEWAWEPSWSALGNRLGQYLSIVNLAAGEPTMTNAGSWLAVIQYERPLTTDPTRAVIKMRNKVSQYCLGVQGADAHAADGALAEVSLCTATEADPKQDQEWILVPTSGDYFRLMNANNGRCLNVQGVDSHSNGAVVEVWSCAPTASDPMQDAEWKLADDQLVNRKSGHCLGVPGVDQHGLGAGIEVYDCAPTADDRRVDERWLVY